MSRQRGVGIAVVLILVVIAFFALRGKESGTVGIGSVGIGEKVAPFAVPVASSDLDGDANIDPEKACEVDLPHVIRICDYFGKPLVMSFWFTKGVSGCDDQQDVFDELEDRYKGRVGLLSINVRDDRDKVRGIISEHGWKVPVGYDRDGAVSNIYKVGLCPTFLFIKPGGILKNAEIGTKTLPELEAQVRSLLRSGS
ncbi:MAG: TlpA family protein disulfide reductase [Solirubrobacterales bacterium]